MAQAWPPLYTKPGKFSLGRGPQNSIAKVGGGAGYVPGTVGGGAFSPADLFASGDGGWWDFSDTTKGFSDAGTTPIANGVSAQQWNDSSGKGNTVSQATAGNRPVWNTAGSLTFTAASAHYLFKSAALITGGLYAAGACSMFAAVKANPATTARLCAEGSSAAANPIYGLLEADNGTATTLAGFIRNDAGAGLLSDGQDLALSAFDNTLNRVGCIDNGTTVTSYLDGVAGTPFAYTARTGSVTVDRFAIGALLRAAASNHMQMDLYQLVVISRVLTAGEIASLDTYFATKMGV